MAHRSYGAPGEIGRQLRCLVAASPLRLSADYVGLGANSRPGDRSRCDNRLGDLTDNMVRS